MMINTESLVSITEANQNFSRVARLVDQTGQAVILKNNVPRYLVLEFPPGRAGAGGPRRRHPGHLRATHRQKPRSL